jgi:glutathione synthase/RimK-type ligase-like ATP-grasp enzyme
MSQLLIITSESDIHADAVIKALQESGVEAIRLNSESFIQQSEYHFAWGTEGKMTNNTLYFRDSLRQAKDIKVIWWRKPEDFLPYASVTDPWAIKYAHQETESLMLSLHSLFPKAKWVNNYYNMRLPSHRINQIPVAQQLGIFVPPTIVTNCYQPALNFIKKHRDCIVKPMSYSGFLHQDKPYGCYTRSIDIETLEALRESIHLAPLFLQRRIAKKAEYRVTLIGHQHFVCRLDVKHLDDPDANMDWRVIEPEKVTHIPDMLPDAYIQKLRGMLDVFGLNFGAFDIIRDDDDKLYFIELNPNGQWYWIELLTGMPMVKAMVELITNLASQK